MKLDIIQLFEAHPEVILKSYVHTSNSDPRPAVVVCPGGGYSFVSQREAEPVAEFYYSNGMNAYIIYYSVEQNAQNYLPLIEVASVIKYVREHAEEHNTAPDKIVTCGFSAGGHLAASAGILWNIPEVRTALGVESGDAPEGINRPNGMILSYPVISAGEYAHRGSIGNLSGREDYTEEDIHKYSLELRVDDTTPPMFIWHTVTDTCVPIRNTTLLMNAYLEHGISFESHIYPKGGHGMSLANWVTAEGRPWSVDPHVATWADLSVMWIRDMFK